MSSSSVSHDHKAMQYASARAHVHAHVFVASVSLSNEQVCQKSWSHPFVYHVASRECRANQAGIRMIDDASWSGAMQPSRLGMMLFRRRIARLNAPEFRIQLGQHHVACLYDTFDYCLLLSYPSLCICVCSSSPKLSPPSLRISCQPTCSFQHPLSLHLHPLHRHRSRQSQNDNNHRHHNYNRNRALFSHPDRYPTCGRPFSFEACLHSISRFSLFTQSLRSHSLVSVLV